MNVDIFGYFAAILTTAAFLPQLIKTLKTKKADDVSLTTLIMLPKRHHRPFLFLKFLSIEEEMLLLLKSLQNIQIYLYS